MMRIPVCEPTISEEDIAAVAAVIRAGEVSSSGKHVSLFEEAFSKWLGVNRAVSVNSGGSALFLALKALGIKEGDEVVIPNFTMVAVANAVLQCGATPVLVDCEPETGNIRSDLMVDAISARTKAVIVVHIYGHPCDMDPIMEITKKYALYLIEDAAEAHGALYKGRKVGTFGDVTCFSFYANKIITTGEGGMITTNSESLADRCADLRAWCFGARGNRFVHTDLGWSMRMSAMEAALGLSQLQKIDDLIAARRANAAHYREGLKDCLGITFLEEKCYAFPVYWMCGILSDKKQRLMDFLSERGVETRSFFAPMSSQPHIGHARCVGGRANCEYLLEHGLYLPSSSHLTAEDRTVVINAVKDFQLNKR